MEMKYTKTMKIFLFPAIFFAVFFIFGNEAKAADYYVSPSGSDNSTTGSESAPFKTIQKAADVVNPGDTVIVKDGTYTDTDNNGYIVWLKRSGTPDAYITFKSENKWGAILHGQNNKAGQGFMITDSASYINIYDFQITECSGGGVVMQGFLPAAPIAYILVKGNYVHHMANYDSTSDYGQGGAFGTMNAHDIIFDSNIGHHLGRTGPDTYWLNKDHGIYIAEYSGKGLSWNITVINNIFYNCSGSTITMGGDNNGGYGINISNNFFAWSNHNPQGGAQLVDTGNTITNSIIQNNIFYQPGTSSSGTPAFWFWYTNDLSTVIIRNNIVYEGTMLTNGIGNLVPPERMPKMQNNYCTRDCDNPEINPMLVDATNKDFHLQSGSPAINTGLSTNAPAYDFDGNLRTGNPDIGAYEYIGVPPVDIISPAAPQGLLVQ